MMTPIFCAFVMMQSVQRFGYGRLAGVPDGAGIGVFGPNEIASFRSARQLSLLGTSKARVAAGPVCHISAGARSQSLFRTLPPPDKLAKRRRNLSPWAQGFRRVPETPNSGSSACGFQGFVVPGLAFVSPGGLLW
ncbi:hypothetical protein QTL95_14730 [Rhizobium sp. S152]|uniref:hypothetical protein n=1 Tax=Rhizobium sp. S152 TaxID=3055038 RepID=UPI0025A9F650|nr:hypothetical protein [Rhizobium sp. S152]MDM9627161.1 hypothetical protein [Rhizobium sp. S152]